MARLGIIEAWLPMVCLVAYLVLELDWIFSNQAEEIGGFRTTAWSLVEIGIIGGSSLVIYRLRELCRRIHLEVRAALEEDHLQIHEEEGSPWKTP
jgi:hypothetical protein